MIVYTGVQLIAIQRNTVNVTFAHLKEEVLNLNSSYV